MKRGGIVNAALAGRCAALGHTDQVAIADCGLPLPAGVTVVDLSLVRGIPSFVDVLSALVGELVIEEHTVAEEAAGTVVEAWVADQADGLGRARTASHEELKRQLAACRLIVRTGEATPFANVILRCGVSF